jgi:PHD/YefM family antitoxin component YafN of YafNO toxin-antitoxin module
MDEKTRPSDVEVEKALKAYLTALDEFEVVLKSADQQTISRASEKISRTLEQLARRKEQFERGEGQTSTDDASVEKASRPPVPPFSKD